VSKAKRTWCIPYILFPKSTGLELSRSKPERDAVGYSPIRFGLAIGLLLALHLGVVEFDIADRFKSWQDLAWGKDVSVLLAGRKRMLTEGVKDPLWAARTSSTVVAIIDVYAL
jgi:hypothetical protein